jgi:prepilin-type N-terminal cleavage/methylation domain-containing protein
MNRNAVQVPPRRHGFTMTELLVVIGLIAILASMLLPVIRKTRAAAHTTVCLSNLRQMGVAWQMYVAENHGRVMEYVFNSPSTPDISYKGYWPGILENAGVRGSALLCPAASEPTPSSARRGYGTAGLAWNGKFGSNGTGLRMNAANYRVGSYGYNRYLTVDGGFAKSNRITGFAGGLSDVPVFMDAIYADVWPTNFTPDNKAVQAPPNLLGDKVTPGTSGKSQEHWKFLIARHGQGVNVYLANGGARWVRLEDMYQLAWKSGWMKYRLDLRPPPQPAQR